MKVPFLELHPAYKELQLKPDTAYRRTMDSDWYLLGPGLQTLKQEFAAYCDVKHCVVVGKVLHALHVILPGYDIGVGDERT
jgi:dTDP-4-amino-4,6-dideoxygalactose transaminase